MVLLSCPKCKKDVSDEATFCPHCGSQLNVGIEEDRQSQPQAKSRNGCRTGCLVILAIFAVIIIISLSFGSGNTSTSSGSNNSRAIAYAQIAVQEQLKAPSTAKFCSYRDIAVTNNENIYIVKGWVDAENSFGAMIRSDFTVKVELLGKDSYRILNVSIN